MYGDQQLSESRLFLGKDLHLSCFAWFINIHRFKILIYICCWRSTFSDVTCALKLETSKTLSNRDHLQLIFVNRSSLE